MLSGRFWRAGFRSVEIRPLELKLARADSDVIPLLPLGVEAAKAMHDHRALDGEAERVLRGERRTSSTLRWNARWKIARRFLKRPAAKIRSCGSRSNHSSPTWSKPAAFWKSRPFPMLRAHTRLAETAAPGWGPRRGARPEFSPNSEAALRNRLAAGAALLRSLLPFASAYLLARPFITLMGCPIK
jgi:hypothetical protein